MAATITTARRNALGLAQGAALIAPYRLKWCYSTLTGPAVVSPNTPPIIPGSFLDIEGYGGQTGRDHHGKPVGLADHEICGRHAGRAWHRPRGAHRIGSPLAPRAAHAC